MVQYNFLPLIWAETAVHKGTPDNIVSHELEPLASEMPYEAGANSLIRLGTAYVRGEAYLNMAVADWKNYSSQVTSS
jgi:hypothetical protein